ncbi:hypothetical protein GCM10010329_80700 [Streptomyces spiroverticillatus]|uniref:Uncharacterized protein n=1 Tax=Streptomyces finlayi TaxID=67296 RepID=A0A918X6W7_9ACTN|nr:hypothetical protein [Streptomyces finlayi]GHA45954.1 hypothetical protein GCM10010329_80700 [Streptomyces spiroverticillatus]GHD16010.1 hypothetical protein GCM10010334_76620 [Streptomyces finlayi]
MTQFWIGTYHGRHDGTQAKATATRDDTRPEPYAWACICGASRAFADRHEMDLSAWRHTHPTRLDRMRQHRARRWRARQARRTGSLTS